MRIPFIKLLTHMLWPVSCPVCGAVGELLCEGCLRSMLRPQLPRCLWCGENIPCKVHGGGARGSNAHGGSAHKEDAGAKTYKIYSASVYEGAMKDVILALKYGRYEALGGALGRGMAEALQPHGADVLVPVPLHLKSKRRYNQAESIARGLGAAWGIEVLPAARWRSDVQPRAGLGASERMALRSGVFAFKNLNKISGLHVGLVDDVCTTGSTLSALGKAAMSHGAASVRAFAAAHVPPIP